VHASAHRSGFPDYLDCLDADGIWSGACCVSTFYDEGGTG
jgi:hypothetical protein